MRQKTITVPPPPRERPNCPTCGEEVRAAVKAVTGYVLFVPCGCRGIDPEYFAVYEMVVKR